jgi:LAO/AO transport system ATPase
MVEELLDRLRQRDRHALARLLTLVSRGEALAEIARGLPEPAQPARVVALTGSGGVGKSTLLGKLLPVVRAHGLTAAVLACDPQSPLSGGALLGDRFRMGSSVDDGVFIRSVAAVGGRGAVAEHVELMIRLLEVFGFDVLFVETVGAGQGDVAVSELADVVVLLLQPETGDDVQWEKAGILELADVVVIHKADLPGAEQTAAQVQAALGLTPERQVPVVRVSSQTGQGLDELWQALEAKPPRLAHEESVRAQGITKIGPADHGRRMSLAEFEHAEMQAGYLYELGRGVIVVSDIPNPKHMAVVLGTRDQLIMYQFTQPTMVHSIAGGAECKILLADLQSERHPDIALYKTPPPDDDDPWSIWIPELVIEVVSLRSELRDYEEKREEYLAFGVKEYWIIDAQRREMLALRRYRGRWRETIVPASGEYKTPLLPSFSLGLSQVLPLA